MNDDDYWERYDDEPPARRRTGCLCAAPGEMPGTCPGPDNCPLCDDDSEDDNDDDTNGEDDGQ